MQQHERRAFAVDLVVKVEPVDLGRAGRRRGIHEGSRWVAGNVAPLPESTSGGIHSVCDQVKLRAAAASARTSFALSATTVDGTKLGRTKLGAVPFALEANHATTTDSASSADTAEAAGGELKATL